MAGRVGRRPDGEPADGPGQLDELGRVGQLARARRRVLGRVATEGHEVLDAGLAQRHQVSANSRRVWATPMMWAMG